jgi:hypothetical protein
MDAIDAPLPCAHSELARGWRPLAERLSGETLFIGELFLREGHRAGGDLVGLGIDGDRRQHLPLFTAVGATTAGGVSNPRRPIRQNTS